MARARGIREKFTLYVFAAVGIFLTALFGATLSVVRGFASDSARELSETILQQTGGRIDRFFGEIEDLAESLAAWEGTRRADEAAMGGLFVPIVASRADHLRAIYLGTARGAMHEWGEGPEFVAHRPTFPRGYDPRTRPWYSAALAAGGFAISPPYRFASVDALGISCSIPVRDRGGSLVGVLGFDILLEKLSSILRSINVPRGGEAMLLSATGEIVAGQEGGSGRALALAPSGIAGIEGRLAAGGGGFTAEWRGEIVHFEAARAGRAPWFLVLAMPYESIMGSVVRLMSIVTVMELVLLAALAALLWGIANRLILAPLRHIVGVVSEVQAGGKEARVALDTGDEFALLGGELNSLMDALAEQSGKLEEKVLERTEELARLQAENTRLGIAEERKRISRDIHDSLGARLTNIFFCNNVARSVAREDPARLAALQDDIESNCLQAVRNLKEIVWGMAEDERLRSDFSRLLVAGMRRRLAAGGVALKARIEGREALNALDPAARSDIERMTLELVSNVLKHAGATKVAFSVRAAGGSIRLRFADDGAGYDPGEARPGGYGLRSLSWRVERLGGAMESESAPGRGASYLITVPAPRAAEGGAA